METGKSPLPEDRTLLAACLPDVAVQMENSEAKENRSSNQAGNADTADLCVNVNTDNSDGKNKR